MSYLNGVSGPAAVSVVELERRSDRELSRRTRRIMVKFVLNFRRCPGAGVPEIVIQDTLTGDEEDDQDDQDDCC